ncbi:MAG: B12-binding domain-containing protein, partial [Gemmatimonadaceae bacterium]|nr:B12-binding domain-containing protein [Chitinophagaceae bacterium]
LAEDDILSLTRNQAKGDADAAINKLVESALDYDETRFEECIQEAITDTDLLSAVKNVIYPFMDMVGLLWLTNHVIPGQEHFSSAIIRRKIIAATDRLPRVKNSGERSVLVFTPSGEEHEIPILIAQYIMRKNKVQTVFAGADTTVELLEEFCRHHPATHLYFHLITNFTEKSAGEYLTDLCNRFPETKIIASGPAMKDCAPAKENCIILRSFDEMADYCSSLK